MNLAVLTFLPSPFSYYIYYKHTEMNSKSKTETEKKPIKVFNSVLAILTWAPFIRRIGVVVKTYNISQFHATVSYTCI